MLKKIFSIFFAFLIVFSSCFSVLAYEPTGVTITAKAGMLASLDTGEILYEKNIDDKVYPASIAKIMTAMIVLESPDYDPDEHIAMTKEVLRLISGTGSAVSNLKIGEEITAHDLVYCILISSYGDCAYLAAIRYGGSVDGFVSMMNEKAKELKLTGTHYGNPVGLHDEETYTTVRDILTLTCYALKNETFKTATSTVRYKMPATNMSEGRTLSTTNFLHDNTTNYFYSYAHGVKTGYTDEAGRCLVSTASFNGYNYICILMNCPANKEKRYEFSESRELYRWAFNNFSFMQVADTENPVAEISVRLSRDTDFVPLYVENGFVSVLPSNADSSTIIVKPKLIAESVDAPIKKGQVLGTADIIYAEQVIGTVNLVAGNSVEASGLLTVLDGIKQIFTSNYMKILYCVIILVIVVFIIMVIRLNSGRGKKRKVKYIPYDKEKDNEH